MDNKSQLICKRTRIVALWQAGLKKSEIIEETGHKLKTINKWLDRYMEFGDEGLLDGRRNNKRQRKTTVQQDDELYRVAKENKFDGCRAFAEQANLHISSSTVARRLKEKGLENGKTCKKILLTERNLQERLAHCHKYLHWTNDQWANVIWSDEKSFKSTTDNRPRIWREKNSRMHPDNAVQNARSSRVTSMYWGCMTSHGLMALQELDLPFTGVKYRATLNDVMYPAARNLFPINTHPIITFMQDNSPIHKAKVVNDWFKEHPDVNILTHPPYSPDLNPIENIWGLTSKNWRPAEQISNVNSLRGYVQHVWDELSTKPDYCLNIVNSMQRRLSDVIVNKGYWCKH